MISLRQITLENRGEVFGLEVADDQRRFVASNLSSIALCYVLTTNGGKPLPFAIYADEQIVGFVMIVYGIIGYEPPKIANNNYCILRLMIDKRYQNRGYGTGAMKKALEFIRTFPVGHAQHCWLAYESDNSVAKKIYESFGFRDNGEICENEIVTVVNL